MEGGRDGWMAGSESKEEALGGSGEWHGHTHNKGMVYLHMGPAPSAKDCSRIPPRICATARAGHMRVGMHGIYLHIAVRQHARA